MDSVMRRQTRAVNRSTVVDNSVSANTDWQVELAVLERNQYYRVLSDIIDSIHEKTIMPTASLDQHVHSNMSSELNSGILLNHSLNVSGNYIESGDNSSLVNASLPLKRLKTEHYVLIVMYSLTTLLAIMGNSLAIVIFTKGKRSKTDLRPFLINLAIADLIMAIFCIPFTFTYQLLDSWVFSRPMCPIVMFLQTVSVTGSVSTNMAIGIDRFCAVSFPLNATRNNPFRYRIIILVIWIISVVLAGVQLFVGDTEPNPEFSQQIVCKEVWVNPDMEIVYTILLLILTYVVPVIILTVTYSIVGYLLWKRNLPGNADIQRDLAQLRSKMKIMKMLITIVVLFAVCWLPIHTFYLVLTISAPKNSQTLYMIYFLCHWVAMSNSFVNPIVYGFLNDSFRADLKALVHRIFSFDKNKRTVRHGAVKFKSSKFGTYRSASTLGDSVQHPYHDFNSHEVSSHGIHSQAINSHAINSHAINSHNAPTPMARAKTVTTSFLRL